MESTMEEEKTLIMMSDLDLIRKAKAGDAVAFGQLYRKHAAHIYATCLRMLANRSRAEEMAQEAIVKAWQMLSTFRSECPFSAWLHRIAVNTVLDHLRREKRLQARVEFTAEVVDGDDHEPRVSLEDTLDLEAAIASLPDHARTILVLHDIEGYKHEEIAEMMGIATGTSKAQLHRARILLKERVEQ